MGQDAEEIDGLDKEKVDDADSSSGSDSEYEGEGEGGKRTREQLEQDEVEALRSDLGMDLREGKRVRTMNEAEAAETTEDSAKKEEPNTLSEKVWDSLKSQSSDTKEAGDEKKDEMVLVKKSYRFAGEMVNEEKLLPASHPDAIAYFTKQNGTAASTSAVQSQPAPGPRKKKSSLAAMSAAATGKPTKINTLEKSKMDWNKFKELNADEAERDEMEAQTKGGGSGLGSMKGYMDRKSFLDRVEGRVEDQRKG